MGASSFPWGTEGQGASEPFRSRGAGMGAKSWPECLEDLRREQEGVLEESFGPPTLSPTPLPLRLLGCWRGRLVEIVQLPNWSGHRGGAGSKAHLVSSGVPGGLGASGPTWPPTTVAGSDPWPREALAGGAGTLTGAGPASAVLGGLAAGEEGRRAMLRPRPHD